MPYIYHEAIAGGALRGDARSAVLLAGPIVSAAAGISSDDPLRASLSSSLTEAAQDAPCLLVTYHMRPISAPRGATSDIVSDLDTVASL